MRAVLALGGASAAMLVSGGAVGWASGGEPAIEVLVTLPFEIEPGPLTPALSSLAMTKLFGYPRATDSGDWFVAGVFPRTGFPDSFDGLRDVVILKNGEPYLREGLLVPGDPGVVPAVTFNSDLLVSVSLGGDGTPAIALRAPSQFSLLPDGLPDPASISGTTPKLVVALVDRREVLREGEQVYIVPGLPPEASFLEDLLSLQAAGAGRVLVQADLNELGTPAPDARVLFELMDAGGPSESRRFLLTSGAPTLVPPAGLPFGLRDMNVGPDGVGYSSGGDVVLGVGIAGAPEERDEAILYRAGTGVTWSVAAREGEASPIAGRVYDGLAFRPVAVNAAGDVGFLASVSGVETDDDVLVVNGAVVAQEGVTVGTAAPGPLAFDGATESLQMDPSGNVVWCGSWSAPKSAVCPDSPYASSGPVRFEGLFFNDELLVEGGVSTIHDVVIDGVLYPELVIADLPNTGADGFHVSANGRWLVFQALVTKPFSDPCVYSLDSDAAPLTAVLLRIDLDEVRGGAGCNAADLAEPFGELTFADISAFLGAFNAGDAAADLAAPFGVFSFADITAFLGAYSAGCG